MTTLDERSKAIEVETAERQLQEAEQSAGKDSPEIIGKLDSLSGLYYRDGLYAKAELLYRRSVDILSKGNATESIVAALSRLSLVYRTEQKLDDAESVCLRALALSEQASACARLHAERLCCLSGIYFDKSEMAQCEDLLKKAVAAYQTAFGQHSCYSRLCSIALAAVCQRLGKNGEADDFFEQSRMDSGTDATTGDDRALLELLQAYYAQSRWNEVESLLRQSVFTDEERLFPEHPRAAAAIHERAELFRAQGRFEDAEREFRRALTIREKVLGMSHPEVAASAMSLATMYLSQNRCGDAETALRCALKVRVRAFGVESPAVAACIETYAMVLKRTKRTNIAQKLDARARDIRSRLVTLAERATDANRPQL